METTRLDRCVDAEAINRRRELFLARRHPTLSSAASNRWIADVLAAGQPAAIGQIGKPECDALSAHLGLRQFYKYTWAAPSYSEAELPEVGVFPPTDEIYWRFCELMRERLRTFDAFAMRLNTGESEILATECSQARRLETSALEPWLFDQPWSAQLAGKRVLVIHPFESSIRAQFSRRTEIWPQPARVLPAFQLDVTRSPAGFSRGGFNDWLAMNQWFEERIEAIYRHSPFDVALIGGGACSIPLTALAKKLGAIGIHLGELAPILFGIRAGAWDQEAAHQRFINTAWVQPRSTETAVPFSR